MLPAARERARRWRPAAPLSWRTVNGEEASAYYAAGSAQVHINADIAHALAKYVQATGDERFLVREGIDVLIETARMWAELGFWRSNGERSFHIHGVTGPDEYTTVVNNNLFTNVMARFNLEQACLAVARIREQDPDEFVRIAARLRLLDEEVDEWQDCAAGMRIPFDQRLGIHPQDDFFLDREVWDVSKTPDETFPLMLHYHPLVQPLPGAQAGRRRSRCSSRATGSPWRRSAPTSSTTTRSPRVTRRSRCRAVGDGRGGGLPRGSPALFPPGPLCRPDEPTRTRSTGCTSPPPAGSGRAWAGFGGMRDHNGVLSSIPAAGVVAGCGSGCGGRPRVQAELTDSRMVFTLLEGGELEVPIVARDAVRRITEGSPVVVELPDQGARLPSHLGDHLIGGRRADGSTITADVPEPIHPPTRPPRPGSSRSSSPRGRLGRRSIMSRDRAPRGSTAEPCLGAHTGF